MRLGPRKLGRTGACRRRSAATLVEAAVSLVIVSVMIVAALNTVGAARRGQFVTFERGRGLLLAQELLSEIMGQAYGDPDEVTSVDLRAGSIIPLPLSTDTGESAGSRSDFDDVDDYHGWSAQPPQNKDGTPLSELADWRRRVTVERVARANLLQLTAEEEGLKRITVTIEHKGKPVAELVAIKGAGLPPVPTGPRVLMVVGDPGNLNDQELTRRTLIESWAYRVSPIAVSAPPADFDAAVESADVAYVTTEVAAAELGGKLKEAAIGVVNENPYLMDDFALATGAPAIMYVTDVSLVDIVHYVTSPLSLGDLPIVSSSQPCVYVTAGLAPGAAVLGQIAAEDALLIVDSGGLLADGLTAAGRRLELPWGAAGFDAATLGNDGQTILKRALEWASGKEQP